jgi:hypothetical protein
MGPQFLRALFRFHPEFKVSFVVGGAQKCGTSAMDAFLRQHPQIGMPRTGKELHFFDDENNFSRRPNYGAYHAHFRPSAAHRIFGESTPIYMYWESAPARIWKYNPDMKWIILLRNPVERAYSAWRMEHQRGADPFLFAEAITREVERCSTARPLQHRVFSYLDRGYYAHQVRRLHRLFGPRNCLCLLTEDLMSNHADTLKKIFRFLEVDPGFTLPAPSEFEPTKGDGPDPDLGARLTDLFYYDIRELESLLNRDLSAWYA